MHTLLSRNSPISKATVGFLLVLIASVALVYTGNLTGEEWCGLLQWCFPAFIGGEAARKFSSATSVKVYESEATP